MKPETFHLSTPAIRANCLAFISQLDDPQAVVSIRNKKETRSAAQHRLKWRWCGFLAKERAGNEGWDREGWNRFFKGKYMRSLLLAQDEDYHEFYAQADRMLESAPDETAKQWAKRTFIDAIKTEWLNVANMSEFMTMIDRYCLTEYGVRLPVPDDLKYAYERAA